MPMRLQEYIIYSISPQTINEKSNSTVNEDQTDSKHFENRRTHFHIRARKKIKIKLSSRCEQIHLTRIDRVLRVTAYESRRRSWSKDIASTETRKDISKVWWLACMHLFRANTFVSADDHLAIRDYHPQIIREKSNSWYLHLFIRFDRFRFC